MLPYEDRVLLQNTFTVIKGYTYVPEEIDQLIRSLGLYSDALSDAKIDPIQSTWYGSSHNGSFRVGTNTEMAQNAVEEELSKMAQGLRQYGTEISTWAKEVEATDQIAQIDLSAGTACVTDVPDQFDVCSIPTEEG